MEHKKHVFGLPSYWKVQGPIAGVSTIGYLCIEVFPGALELCAAGVLLPVLCVLIVNFACGSAVGLPFDCALLRLAGVCSYAACMYPQPGHCSSLQPHPESWLAGCRKISGSG